jgi:hypothetical protein
VPKPNTVTQNTGKMNFVMNVNLDDSMLMPMLGIKPGGFRVPQAALPNTRAKIVSTCLK